ncbi:MAG: hypothetical protein ACJAT2_003685 [Bacteriovoracaceae bacterium]|jgi:hypothetical protein
MNIEESPPGTVGMTENRKKIKSPKKRGMGIINSFLLTL